MKFILLHKIFSAAFLLSGVFRIMPQNSASAPCRHRSAHPGRNNQTDRGIPSSGFSRSPRLPSGQIENAVGLQKAELPDPETLSPELSISGWKEAAVFAGAERADRNACFAELLLFDLYSREKLKSRPRFLPDYGLGKDEVQRFLSAAGVGRERSGQCYILRFRFDLREAAGPSSKSCNQTGYYARAAKEYPVRIQESRALPPAPEFRAPPRMRCLHSGCILRCVGNFRIIPSLQSRCAIGRKSSSR